MKETEGELDDAGFGNDFPGGSPGKESAYSAGDWGLICGLGKSPGEGNGYLI